jgi:hypothetical protein
MGDMSDYTVSISHEDVEEIVREQLKEVIKSHKLDMLMIERDGGKDINEDYQLSKRLIHAAATLLHYYSVPSDWKKVEKIIEEHEV